MSEETQEPQRWRASMTQSYDRSVGRWRASVTRGYDLSNGSMQRRAVEAEGHTRREAIEALVRLMADLDLLVAGDEPMVQLDEIGGDADDDIPDFQPIRVTRDAQGGWAFDLLSLEEMEVERGLEYQRRWRETP